MKLFFKHIFRSLCKHPLQPILIILTLSMSVCVCVTALGISRIYTKYNTEKDASRYMWGDIIVRIGAHSEERMLFSDDAEQYIKGAGEVFGDYSLIGHDCSEERRLVRICAADLEAADTYFDFDFYKYGGFTDSNIKASAVISKQYADDNGIALHDSISLEILGQSASYTVEAIADDEVYFKECDVLIDISGAVELLAKKSPAIASLGDSFIPSSRLMIRLDDKSRTDSLFAEISQDGIFSDDYIERVGENSTTSTNQMMESIILFLLTFLTVLLCTIVIVNSMHFLGKQREYEMALFRISGASFSQISRLRFAENLVYAAISCIIGLIPVPLTIDLTASSFGWYRGDAGISAIDILFGMAVSVLLTLICTALALYRSRKRSLLSVISDNKQVERVGSEKYTVSLIILGISSIIFVFIFICPVPQRYILAIPALICEILLAYYMSPFVLSALASLGERILTNTRQLPSLLIALKNIKRTHSHKQICRLISVLGSLLITISLLKGVIYETSNEYKSAFSDDIVAIGMSERIEERLASDFQGANVLGIYFCYYAELEQKYPVMMISTSGEADTPDDQNILPPKLPSEDEIVIPQAIAALCGSEIGDTVNFSFEGNNYELTVSDIYDNRTNLVFIDQASLDISSNTSVILTDESQKDDIMIYLESEGVAILSTYLFDARDFYTLDGFLSLAEYAFILSLTVSLIGLCNMLSEQIALRKHEREILILSGMRKTGVRKMYILEMIFILIVSALFSLLFSQLLIVTTNILASSFGFTLI